MKATQHLSKRVDDLRKDVTRFIDVGDFGYRFIANDGDALPFDISSVSDALRLAKIEFQTGLNIAGEGNPGRPSDDAAVDLSYGAFQVWARTLKREFRLDWTKDNEPLTDAAEFCVAVAQAVSQELGINRIAKTARKIRETAIPISSLEKLEPALDHYSEQKLEVLARLDRRPSAINY